MIRVALVSLAALLLTACVSDEVKETAETVLTLQSGTMSELRQKRGTGPFTFYHQRPADMLRYVERAARMARDEAGEPVRAIFVSHRRGEVVAKERAGEHTTEDGYEAPFRTAMLAVVHSVRDAPGRSRVEIHMIQRGPFHRGVVNWTRDMPRWIAAAIEEDKAYESAPLAPIPP